MKKVIALTLCMLFLLSGCGYLGGAAGALVEMRDLYITDADQALDMRGLSAAAEIACSDAAYGLRLTVADDSEIKNELVAAVVDDSVLILLNGGTGEPYAFVIDDPEVVEPIEEAFASVMAGAPAGDEGVDIEDMTDEELDEYMAQLEEQLESMLQEEGLAPEESDEAAAQAERMAELLEQCVTEGEPQEFEGEMFDTTNFELPNDKLLELLDMLDTTQYIGEDVDLSGALTEAGITLDLSGVAAVNADGTKTAFGVTPVLTNADGDTVTLNITFQQMSEDDSIDFYIDIAENGQDLGSLSLTFNVQQLDEADWLPEAVSDDAQPVDFDDEASAGAFSDALADFFGQVSGTLAGRTAGNGAIGALE